MCIDYQKIKGTGKMPIPPKYVHHHVTLQHLYFIQ
jgi:hypothetical protein